MLPRLEESHAEPHVLIVDDNSPDGTGEIADGLAEDRAVEVLHRPRKQGLGRAYLAGFTLALERNADSVMEMDADFSHDPADVPRLIAAADADLVLGSRYVPTEEGHATGGASAAAPQPGRVARTRSWLLASRCAT